MYISNNVLIFVLQKQTKHDITMARETKARTRHLLEMTLKCRDFFKMYPNLETDHLMNVPVDAKIIANVSEYYFDIQIVKTESGYTAYWRRNNIKS